MEADPAAYFRELRENLDLYGNAPAFAEMPRRTLQDKGIAGPTAAHFIEEVHVPRNLAGLTFTTGTSAFQNIVGITAQELPLKQKAGRRVLAMAGLQTGDRLLCCYPPLINVFSKPALEESGISWFFLKRSSRDAFLEALYYEKPTAIMGESAFIKTALEDARKLGVEQALPQVKSILVAGTPMDTEMPDLAGQLLGAAVFDVYGCQEFGWLTVNGEPVRDDISLIASALGTEYREFVVGGLPMGDSFPVTDNRHMLGKTGRIITYRRRRTRPDYEVVVMATPLTSHDTIERAARTILRIKGRVVKIHPQLALESEQTTLWLKPAEQALDTTPGILIEGPQKTACFDALTRAQIEYQQKNIPDPAWTKHN